MIIDTPRSVAATDVASSTKNWEPFSEERLDSDAKVIEAFACGGITYLKGDWTNRDSASHNF